MYDIVSLDRKREENGQLLLIVIIMYDNILLALSP